MNSEQHNKVSELIQALLPTATDEEQREAERNLDQFLDAIDAVHARLTEEGWYLCTHDKSPRDAKLRLLPHNDV